MPGCAGLEATGRVTPDQKAYFEEGIECRCLPGSCGWQGG